MVRRCTETDCYLFVHIRKFETTETLPFLSIVLAEYSYRDVLFRHLQNEISSYLGVFACAGLPLYLLAQQNDVLAAGDRAGCLTHFNDNQMGQCLLIVNRARNSWFEFAGK